MVAKNLFPSFNQLFQNASGGMLVVLAFVMLVLAGCRDKSAPVDNTPKGDSFYRPKETATRGEISIGADESLRPLVEQWEQNFELIYDEAELNVEYYTEQELFDQMADNNVRLIIATRLLRPAEEKYYEKLQARIKPKELAYNAHVVVLNPENTVDSLDSESIGQIVRGEVTDWAQLGRETPGQIEMLFGQAKSGTVRYISDRYVQEGDSIKGRLYAADDFGDFVAKVASRKNIIGFIGGAYVSDLHDEDLDSLGQRIKIPYLKATPGTDTEGRYVQPTQNELALKTYPFTYTVWALNREPGEGLGTGFVRYAAGERGQRIVLKTGLYPTFPPPRLIEFTD